MDIWALLNSAMRTIAEGLTHTKLVNPDVLPLAICDFPRKLALLRGATSK